MNAAIALCIFAWCAVLKNSISAKHGTSSYLLKAQRGEMQATTLGTSSEQSLDPAQISLSVTGGRGLASALLDMGAPKKRISKRIISASLAGSRMLVPEDMRTYLPKKFRHKQCFFSENDRKAQVCSFCCHFNMTRVSIYVENFGQANRMSFGQFSRYEAEAPSCKLPNGARCVIQHNDAESDAVMKDATVLGLDVWPTRYCYPQVIILINAAGRPKVYGYDIYADITVDQSLSSTILFGNTCHLMVQLLEKRSHQPPDPHLRKGAVMFVNHCSRSFMDRNVWLKSLLNVTSIDSYGRCMNNHSVPPMTGGDWQHNVAVNYRFVIVHEPFSYPGHVSARILHAFLAGAIPVYRGPQEVYNRIPGNHSIIFADDFSTPLELSQYLMRVEADDELFRYHTKLNFTFVEEFVANYCTDWQTSVTCKLCSNAYSHKLAAYRGGGRPCNCRNQPPKMNEDIE